MPGMVRAGHVLILTVVALLVLGVVMVNSAGLTLSSDRAFDMERVLTGRTTILAGLSVVAMLVASRLPIRAMYRARGIYSVTPWLVLTCIAVLAMLYVPGIGRRVNGALRWVEFGPIGFQPSEIIKWSVLIILAWHGARRAGAMGRLGVGFLPPTILVAGLCAVIATQDLGTAVLIMVVAVAVLLASGVRVVHAAAGIPVAALGFIAFVMSSPYRLDRLRAFLNPYEDPQGIGYHVIQSMASISGGGLAGRGLGNSVQKFGYLPEDTTDFIFAIVCEELGVAGAVLVVMLYATVLLVMLSIVRRASHPFARLLSLGVMLTIGLQALINMAVVTGSAPTKGIALPLISSGGTGWLLTAFAIGLVVAVDREEAVGEDAPRAVPAPREDCSHNGPTEAMIHSA